MQANCPQCGNKMVIDDAKVPDRPFAVKCPKCQTAVKFPGKAAAAPAPADTPADAPAPGTPSPAVSAEELRAQMAQLRREMGASEPAGAVGRALVALPGRAVAGTIGATLTRQGFSVDTLDDMDEGARLLEQGVYDLVVTARVGATQGKSESLYQRINRLSPDNRRKLFVVLVGDEFKTGDGTQAFAVLADLVIHPQDAPTADAVLRSIVSERGRLYKLFLEARQRFEAAAG